MDHPPSAPSSLLPLLPQPPQPPLSLLPLQHLDGMIVAYLPEGPDGSALWKNKHNDDGALEDLEEHELEKAVRVRFGVQARVIVGVT